MSTSRAIKPKRDDTQLTNWEPIPERAPSVERDDRPTVARIIAMVGLFLVVLGTLAMFAPAYRDSTVISPTWGFFFSSIGLCLVLYHAFVERELQFRRMYGFLGLALVVGGVVIRLMAFRTGYGSWFVAYGMPAFLIGLVILNAVVRNETDAHFRTLILNVVGILGALMIAYAGLQGLRSTDYLAGEGVVLLVLGLLFVATYIGQQESNSHKSYRAGLVLGVVGVLGIVATVARCTMGSTSFFVPGGIILSGMSVVYLAVSIGICCDWPIVVLARRDLASYLYSPVGYLVFIGITLLGGYSFYQFAGMIVINAAEGRAAMEPIVARYIFNILPVFVQMFIVPVLTMRLLSEENRSGTLEVLMTAPVNELSVVLAKFIACWIVYMLTWIPFWLYMVSLRYFGNEPFDYLPILSFTLALATISAGLVAMGLFFSSLTSNQIIAAVLTFVGVMLHLVMYFLLEDVRNSTIAEVLTYMNFFNLWQNSLGGNIAPRYLVFHCSVAVFFLFATVKVLESRKWK